MSTINTFMGNKVDILNISSSDINVASIARTLSLICNHNGHGSKFVSVARHSYNCYLETKARGFTPTIQLYALLHDTPKAYLTNLPVAVRNLIPGIEEIEWSIFKAILRSLNIDLEVMKYDIFYHIEKDVTTYEKFKVLKNHRHLKDKFILSKEYKLPGFNATNDKAVFMSTLENLIIQYHSKRENVK